jgi:hypothetical protein
VSASEQPPPRDAQPQNIADAISDITDRATQLVREEVELAKAELLEKGTKIAKGAVVGIVAGVFFLMALIFVLIGGAYLLYFYLPVSVWAFFWGFFAMAAILVVLGVLAGLIAARFVKRGAPPVPSMAIDEAQKIRDSVSSAAEGEAFPSPPPSGVAPGVEA